MSPESANSQNFSRLLKKLSPVTLSVIFFTLGKMEKPFLVSEKEALFFTIENLSAGEPNLTVSATFLRVISSFYEHFYFFLLGNSV